MDSKRHSPPAELIRHLATVFAIVAVIGLAGSALPPMASAEQGPQSMERASSGTVVSLGPVNLVQGQSFAPPTVTASILANTKDSQTNSAPSGTEASGSSQLQQGIWQDAEGMLYEDYQTRRSRILIEIEIAKRLGSEPLGLTEVALLVRLNFSRARLLLDEMTSAGLVQDVISEGGKLTLTSKGKTFLEVAEKAVGMLRSEANADE